MIGLTGCVLDGQQLTPAIGGNGERNNGGEGRDLGFNGEVHDSESKNQNGICKFIRINKQKSFQSSL